MKNRTAQNRGFTLVELMVVVAILGILTSISIMSYREYLDRAKRTVSTSALESARRLIESYAIDTGTYPTTIDFATCTDQNGKQVLPVLICEQVKHDLFSIDSYVLNAGVYTIMAKAIDSGHSTLKMTQDSVIVITP